MKKFITGLFSAALIAGTLVSGAIAAPVTGAGELSKARTDVVQVRNRGGAVAAGAAVGLIGGLAIGSALSRDRGPAYYGCDPRYEYCGERVYARPARRGLVWNDDKGCFVNPNRYWGRCYAY